MTSRLTTVWVVKRQVDRVKRSPKVGILYYIILFIILYYIFATASSSPGLQRHAVPEVSARRERERERRERER